MLHLITIHYRNKIFEFIFCIYTGLYDAKPETRHQYLSEGKGPSTCYSAAYMSRLINSSALQSWKWSWLAWVSGTMAHWVAIHWRRLQTTGPTVQHNKYIISCTRLSPGSPWLLSRSPWLLLINRPCRDGMLSWYWYAAAVGEIQTLWPHDYKFSTQPHSHTCSRYKAGGLGQDKQQLHRGNSVASTAIFASDIDSSWTTK